MYDTSTYKGLKKVVKLPCICRTV